MGQAIQEGSGQPFATHHLDPLFKGQIGRHDQAGAFVGPADDIEQQLGSGLAEGHVAQFVEDQQPVAFQRAVQPLQIAFLALFEQLGDQAGDVVEAGSLALQAGGMAQGAGQMSLARAGVAHQQDVLPRFEVFAAHQLPHQPFVERGLGGEVKAVQGLAHRELRRLQPTFGGPLFPVEEFAFSQP